MSDGLEFNKIKNLPIQTGQFPIFVEIKQIHPMNRFSFLLFVGLSATSGLFAQSNLQLTDVVAFKSGSAADFELVLSAKVANNASDTLFVKARRSLISGNFSSQNFFCWDACYDPSKSVSDIGLPIPNGASIDDFTGHLRPNGFAGTTTIKYCFFNEESTGDSVCFIGRFETAAVGIDDPAALSALILYPNPAADFANLSYTLPATPKNGRLEILNMLGSRITSMPVTNQTGLLTIPVSELESGIYFYSLVSDGQPQRTGKFNVKH